MSPVVVSRAKRQLQKIRGINAYVSLQFCANAMKGKNININVQQKARRKRLVILIGLSTTATRAPIPPPLLLLSDSGFPCISSGSLQNNCNMFFLSPCSYIQDSVSSVFSSLSRRFPIRALSYLHALEVSASACPLLPKSLHSHFKFSYHIFSPFSYHFLPLFVHSFIQIPCPCPPRCPPRTNL